MIMPNKPEAGQSGAEFSRPVAVKALRISGALAFDEEPDATERGHIATFLGLSSVSKMRFKGVLRQKGKSDWELVAKLGATVVQPCVVTLAPVTTRIDVPVSRLFVSELPDAAQVEIELDPETDADIDLLPEVIDLGAVAMEELALAVPEYPRAAGASLEAALPQEPSDDAESTTRPFEVLKSLRDRLPE
jgi:uncharacterized metal-binding protein YceD (DUF177 family)